MSALIVFATAPGGGAGGASNRPDQVRVQEDAEEVVRKLGAATDGDFVDLTPGNKPDQKVWINPAQVRMVRSG